MLINKLGRIDFAKADLSEYFQDVEQQYGTISEADKAQVVHDMIARFTQNSQSNSPYLRGP